ncbi:hypothetical protein ENUP19_0240G0035 [Entamoeba nuttalli]|uniref:Multiple inositol polyphosphate phosphatase 1 n=2 Tax=Entamoeba nuttalli TaxID=412467 RepID=K2HVZ3_ENTNP|nr:histidine acid phosphatase family protein [Entamoeba nuttalli P19]EKE40460.1 histidine acid phosphatase family protein [Entamoeba nuttalli P19]|eukprot:XP_008857205.1 histidine acid phosphatase family protein [Entamoeba nuttalli P19]
MLAVLLVNMVLSCCGYNEDITHCLSTRTPYFLKDIRDPTLDHFTVVHAELVQRHGSRYPTSNDINAMNMMAEKFAENSKITWKNPFPMEMEGELCERGKQELFSLGKYYKGEFKKLFYGKSLLNINITATFKKRTQDSARSWLEGFYDDEPEKKQMVIDNKINITVVPKDKDTQLYFHKNCRRYVEYEKSGSTHKQSNQYAQMKLSETANRFIEAIGMTDIDESTSKSLTQLAFTAGAHEYVVFNKSDGMLKYFNIRDAHIMEYIKDLETYYTKGNFSELNYKIAIPLLDSIINGLKLAVVNDKNIQLTKQDNNILGNFRFAHAETVTPLMTLMGVNIDQFALTVKLNEAKKNQRKWNMSKVSPYSVHFMFVLLKSKKGQYYVRTYFNQEAIVLPSCGTEICLFEDFVKYYEKITKDFDYNTFCSN